jgi:septal ring factor EnvC (AmiA/AmiB activator)
VLTTCGANVSHRDEDGMSVLEHAEQNDRRQVVGLIKRAQLGNQMRQRRKQKTLHKGNGMSMEEFLHREEKAKETMVELLQEIEKESESAESRKARQRAKRTAKKNEKKVAKRKDSVRLPACMCTPVRVRVGATPHRAQSRGRLQTLAVRCAGARGRGGMPSGSQARKGARQQGGAE